MQIQYETRTKDFSTVWGQLEHCHERGIQVLDDYTSQFVYKSYAEYVEAAGKLAAILSAYGIGYGERVLICAETTPNFPVLWLALVWLGAIPVPIPPAYALTGQYTYWERLFGILRHFRFYCCHPDEIEQINEIAAAQDSNITSIELPGLFNAAEHYEGDLPSRAVLTENDTAFVQYTSGSTKAPKGILVSYKNLFANSAAMWERVEFEPDRHKCISWLPLYHDMGLVGMLLSSMINQNDLHLISPQNFARRPLQFLAIAEQCSAQYCCMPNFAYEWILKRVESSRNLKLSMAHFRWLGVGAEPINPRTMSQFIDTMKPFGLHDGVVSPCYGMAEATLAITIAAPGEEFELSQRNGNTLVTCGRPLAGVELDVAGDRIRIRGTSVAKSALINGQAMALADPDGFYDTGDCGYFENGRLVVLGRTDEMFVVNGENYFPYDIEAASRVVEGVLKRRTICFYVPANSASASLSVLLYERLENAIEQAEEIEAEIRSRVLGHTGLNLGLVQGVAPRSIPVTPSGKLQRLRARQLFQDGFYSLQKDGHTLEVNDNSILEEDQSC
jgi:acyl-CoA synthetase (AMP-forming)/AMP-acid ligase II